MPYVTYVERRLLEMDGEIIRRIYKAVAAKPRLAPPVVPGLAAV